MVRADEGAARIAMLGAMAAMFVLAMTIPEAFQDLPGGLPGPVVVGLCYFALGESIVAIGVGMAGLPISWPVVAAAILGLVLAAALWWVYFDTSSPMAERALAAAPEAARARLARDAYSYLHLPLVAGVVLLALGLRKVLEFVGDAEHHGLADPLTGLGVTAPFGGMACSCPATRRSGSVPARASTCSAWRPSWRWAP